MRRGTDSGMTLLGDGDSPTEAPPPATPSPVRVLPRRSRRVRAARTLGRLAAATSRGVGAGSGGVIGGRVLLALAPHAMPELSAGRTLALVTGTNGKTTTAAYLVAGLRVVGPVCTNADGANTP